jgi:hypothetical protein
MNSSFRLKFLVFVGVLELINLVGPAVSDRLHSDPALSAGFMALVGIVLSGKWPGSDDDKDGAP